MINVEQLQKSLKEVSKITNPKNFLCDFLLCFKIPTATLVISGLTKDFSYEKEISFANRLLFCYTKTDNLYVKFNDLISRKNCRFSLIINDNDIICYDSKAEDWLACKKSDIYKYFDFFLPLMGIDRSPKRETVVGSTKTSEKLANLYNELLVNNPGKHNDVNMCFVGFVCCCFAENYGFIDRGSLKELMSMYTDEHGYGLSPLLANVFEALRDKQNEVPEYINKTIHKHITNFNFVFDELTFNAHIRNLLLDIVDYDWKNAEPEFLGSVVQQIIIRDEDNKYNYTNTANIYKVIGPLFMDDLYKEFDYQKENNIDSTGLLNRLSNIVIFDPACGAGNFLVVTYNELKKLENSIKQYLSEKQIKYEKKQYINMYNFFGIESNYIATTITQISMFFLNLKHADNSTTESIFSLPQDNIINAEPLEISWDKFCPYNGQEIYIVGNPSYRGARTQTAIQKQQIKTVFATEIQNGLNVGDLDYAAPWFYLAAKYMNKANSGFAFVTTNSLTQGIHVPTLWPVIFSQNIEIVFAHTSFKWKNAGKNTTAVTVVIIGCKKSGLQNKKYIFDNDVTYSVKEINPYLTSGNVIVYKSNSPISEELPKMVKGNMPYGKELLLSPKEKDELVSLYPESQKYLRRVVGSLEFIHHEERWCLWINESQASAAYEIPLIAERLESVKHMRQQGDANAKKLAEKPYQFREFRTPQKYSLVIPSVSSENRTYFQAGYVAKNVIVTNLCFVIYDAPAWVFGVIESKMHNLWVKTVCGGLETRPRYSNVLGYNTFPLPQLTEEQKNTISEMAYNIIIEREKFPDKNLMELYNDNSMPRDLKFAHQTLDAVVESCYKPNGFLSDQERLNAMFALYKEIKG